MDSGGVRKWRDSGRPQPRGLVLVTLADRRVEGPGRFLNGAKMFINHVFEIVRNMDFSRFSNLYIHLFISCFTSRLANRIMVVVANRVTKGAVPKRKTKDQWPTTSSNNVMYLAGLGMQVQTMD